MKTLDVIVHAISPTSATSRSHELRSATGEALPSFGAGTHIDVPLGPCLIRQYSLCDSLQEEDRYLICVRRDDAGRDGSGTLHRHLTVGRRLRISPPRNHFPLAAAQRHVLVADGIGITPPTVDGRSPGRAGSSVRRCRAARRTAGPGTGPSRPCPRARRLHDPRHGPERPATGRQPGQMHTERFAPAVPSPAGGEVATESTVRIASTGIGYPVPADRTIADGLTAHGVEVALSCEQGVCGACLTPVLAGEPDHRDEVRTPDERPANDRITICCSGAHTPELPLPL